jgi:hypothetical protein
MRITLVLTALAAVVVILTRVRLTRDGGEAAGRLSIPAQILNLHTGAGLLALLTWSGFLLTVYRDAPVTILGWVGLLLWWVTTVAGLLILARWLPARGRHSAGAAADTWGEGPGLSVLAHVGLLVGTCIWSAFMILGKIA